MKQNVITRLASLSVALSTAVAWAAPQGGATNVFAPAFFAFQNGVGSMALEDEAAMLKALGYDGVSQVKHGGERLASRIAAYDKVGLNVLSIYLNVNDKPIAADVVKPLANRDAMIELTVRQMTPATIDAVRATAAMAAEMHIRVALYPHDGFAIATMPQALQLIADVDHPNLGVMFNLCHFLKGENIRDLESVLEAAGPQLFGASISGATLGGTTWAELIQPLDQGDFPQTRVLKTLKRLNFNGPVGLQCYAVPGDKRLNLKRSIAAWKKALEEL
jgi:hypothetical protein